MDGRYTIFGLVEEDHIDALYKINDILCDDEHRPYQDIIIKDTLVVEDPFEDPENLIIPTGPIEISKEVLNSYRMAPEEAQSNQANLSLEELEKDRRKKEAASRALTLEMVGDLPSADTKPPENVLFVCKLNPITTDEDLELIFSRFGDIERWTYVIK